MAPTSPEAATDSGLKLIIQLPDLTEGSVLFQEKNTVNMKFVLQNTGLDFPQT